MDRREALEMARSLAPEASAEAHVVYADFLVGSDVCVAPDAVTAVVPGRDGLYPVGTIALCGVSGTWLLWVREEDGWHLYSIVDGHRYPTARTTEDVAMYDTVVVGMVRPAPVRNPLVGQKVVQGVNYPRGTVSIDADGDVWYFDRLYWKCYSKFTGLRRTRVNDYYNYSPVIVA